MPNLTIDNQPITVEPGTTILEAAARLGITIPTLCFLEGYSPATSCMVCVVKVKGLSTLVPACATIAVDGMEVESESEEVRAARRTALELLLGDHTGDCIGPCQSACPAHMDIPRMIRLISEGRHREAIEVVKEHIALPAVLGRICPEVCEKACRRGAWDSPVSIRLLKRFVADVDLGSGSPYLPERKSSMGKRVAIVGAGPAGLAAAYYLQIEGIDCTIFDDHLAPGGTLRSDVPEERLPREVLDAEIDGVYKLGAEFKMGVRVGSSPSIESLRREFDAVLIAAGKIDLDHARLFGLEMGTNGLKIDKHTMMTMAPGVFAAGSSVTPTKLAVRAVADGRVAAMSVAGYLRGEPVAGHGRPFTVRAGRLSPEEMAVFTANASLSGRVEPTSDGMCSNEARAESDRCLHCECSALRHCKLRDHAIEYQANVNVHRGEHRMIRRDETHPEIIHEPGKCISCGICVQIAEEYKEPLGLAFIGRGFRVELGVPFDEPLSDGLRTAAKRCAESCPTGALVLRNR